MKARIKSREQLMNDPRFALRRDIWWMINPDTPSIYGSIGCGIYDYNVGREIEIESAGREFRGGEDVPTWKRTVHDIEIDARKPESTYKELLPHHYWYEWLDLDELPN